MDRVKIREYLSEQINPKRMEHILGVEYTATALAMRYGFSLEEAAVAGLLHDCAKHLSKEKKFEECDKYGITVSELERKNPELLHAKLGSYYAKDKYGIENEDILNAIACHTTGKPNMSCLDKIIYIADYIEPNRNKAPNLEQLRELAFQDLDRCLLAVLENTITFLKGTKLPIDEVTLETYEYYKSLLKDKK